MEFLITFLEGMITFISPCLLPMLPVYVSYLAGGEPDAKGRRILINASGFILGFTIAFVVMGAFAGSIGMMLRSHQTIVNLVSGLIVVLFGLSFLGIFRLPFFHGNNHEANVHNMNFLKAIIFGMIFSIGWTPCVGAFLGSALMLASQQGSVLKGVLLLLAYSLGLGVPVFISSLLLKQLQSAFTWIKKHYGVINKVCGILLIIVGIAMAAGWLSKLLFFLA